MKRRIALVLLLCLLIRTTVFPAAAQDAPPSRPPCTADEVKQIADTALSFGDQLNAVSTKTYDQTLDGDTAKLLEWVGLYQSFLNDVFPGVPDCIDGVVYGNNVGITLNQQVAIEAALVLDDVQLAAKTDDADLNQGLSDLVQLQSDAVQEGVPAITNLVNQLKAGTATPGWLPACDADQLQFTTQLDDFEQTYASLQSGLQAYLDSGTVDKDTYLAVIKLTTDMATAVKAIGANVCADYYFRALDDAYKFGDTFTALTLAQAAPAISGNDQFDTMRQWLNAFLDAYLNTTTATPES
jgi:hypothetical protein